MIINPVSLGLHLDGIDCEAVDGSETSAFTLFHQWRVNSKADLRGKRAQVSGKWTSEIPFSSSPPLLNLFVLKGFKLYFFALPCKMGNTFMETRIV